MTTRTREGDHLLRTHSIIFRPFASFSPCLVRMSTMTRISNASRSALRKAQSLSRDNRVTSLRSFATASGDDAKKPTALAKLHLEDGTTLVGKSFGSHEAVEGEVSPSSCKTVGFPGSKSRRNLNSKISTSNSLCICICLTNFTNFTLRSCSLPVWLDTPNL